MVCAERVGVSSDLESQVDDLNLWWVDYSHATGAAAPVNAAQSIGRWLGDEAAQTATADRFNVRDAAHIRDCLLYRAPRSPSRRRPAATWNGAWRRSTSSCVRSRT